MANIIELIIKIPKENYERVKFMKEMGAINNPYLDVIANGIPRETVTEFADRCRECGREKVLDKIRDEVCDIDDEIVLKPDSLECKAYVRAIKVIDIIDKYRKGE